MYKIMSILFAINLLAFAHQKLAAQNTADNSFVLIVEPFSPINGGFDIGLGYGFSKHKVEIKYRQTSKSDPIAQQKDDFDSKYKNFEISYNYFLKEHLKGFFAGGTFNYFKDFEVTKKVSKQTVSKDFQSIGLRFGYYWYPFKKINLFIDPTLALNFNLNDKDLAVNGKIFDKQIFRLPPAGIVLRIGYKF